MREIDPVAATGRVYRLMAVLAAGGVVASAFLGGTPVAIGFCVGAIFSGVNFWFWHRVVQSIGRSGDRSSVSTVLFGGRYLFFVLAAYATLQYFRAGLFAALAGCFVAVAAVLLEILLELFFLNDRHGT